MVKRDGDYVIYRLQFYSVSSFEYGGKANGVWCYCNFDSFGYPPGFDSSGECWQKTGEHGVFSQRHGYQGLNWIAERNKGRKFRLVKVRISQKTIPISEITINDVEAKNGREDVEKQV